MLVRTGQTEGSVDLARLAGLKPAGVICEIMREDGEMARLPELEAFARTHELLMLDDRRSRSTYRLARRRCWSARWRRRAVRPALGRRSSEFRAYSTRPTSRTPSTSRWCSATSRPDEPVLVRVQTRRACCATCSGCGAAEERSPGDRVAADDRGGGQRDPALRLFARAAPACSGGSGGAPTVGGRSRRACATSAWARRCWRTWARARSGC